MEENNMLLESLVDRATDYGKTSYELVKLKAVDKSSDIISSVIPHTIVLILAASFMIFFNLGLAFWLGEILGRLFYGFFVVAGFYVLMGMIVHHFMYIRKLIGSFIQLGVTNIVAKHPDAIRTFGQYIIEHFLSRNQVRTGRHVR